MFAVPRYPPPTKSKIAHWHQTFKNRILLENYHLPGDTQQQIDAFAALNGVAALGIPIIDAVGKGRPGKS